MYTFRAFTIGRQTLRRTAAVALGGLALTLALLVGSRAGARSG